VPVPLGEHLNSVRAFDIVYSVDSGGRIERVSNSWNAFAADNDAPELIDAAVIGRPLVDFIAGSETKHVFDLLSHRVRAGHVVTLPFRCDAPGRRRRMRLTMTGVSDGGIEFRSTPLEEVERPAQPLLDRGRSHGEEWLKVCSWCKRVKVVEQWVEIERAAEYLQLFDPGHLPQITHGMCQDCYQSLSGACNPD
jgi:hypothetical protein